MWKKRAMVMLFSLFLLFSLPVLGEKDEGIIEYLQSFQGHIDERVEIFHLEMNIEGKNLTLSGEVSARDTLDTFINGLTETFKEHQITVQVSVLNRGYGFIHEKEILLRKTPSDREK